MDIVEICREYSKITEVIACVISTRFTREQEELCEDYADEEGNLLIGCRLDDLKLITGLDNEDMVYIEGIISLIEDDHIKPHSDINAAIPLETIKGAMQDTDIIDMIQK